MQEGPRLRRLPVVLVLALGYFAGSTAVAGLLWLFQHLVGVETISVYVLVVAALLAIADAWAIVTNRLFPLTLRRQARKDLLYRLNRQSLVGFLWGLDAGLGFTTYRLSSGIWILSLLVLFGGTSPFIVLVLAGGFSGALLGAVLVPLRTTDDVGYASYLRVDRMTAFAPKARLVYLGVLVAWLLAALIDLRSK